MMLTIDVHPAMMNSPKEIGELVIKQMKEGVEGRQRTRVEVSQPVKWQKMKNLSNPNKLIIALSGRPLN